VVAARATGARDAVVDGVTGMLVAVGDARGLAEALETLLRDGRMREEMGAAGRERVVKEFRPERIWEAMAEEYQRQWRVGVGTTEQKGLAAETQTAHRSRRASQFVKRVVDVVVAGAGLALMAPVMAVVAAAIWVSDGGPALFRQKRPGYKGEPFVLVKFRTMREARGKDGRLLADGERLTTLGRWLRALSLDELPQLWNVLRGEMSLVGPRPLLMEYLERYSAEEMRRHEAKPGMTGWAQIHGRNATSWRERFALDLWYVEHWSLGLDARILLSTVSKVVTRRGVSSAGHPTMPEFLGSEQGD
jgi:lipopolysaccharide/colanic/teichoic acid biosynthesis glycosyltransferase